MELNELRWTSSKIFIEDGSKMKIQVYVKLDDECKNGHCDFGITGTVWRLSKNGRWITDRCGCIHEDIVKHFHMLEKFIPLHTCNYLGHPLYPVENGQYFIREKGKDVAMEELRIAEEEYNTLLLASDKEGSQYFKYLLYSLGIVDRWKKEADEFIKFIEGMVGHTWVNPYNQEEERNVMHLTDDERNEIELKISNGYYTKDNIEARRNALFKSKQEAIRDKVIAEYEKSERKAREERDIKLYLFDSGMPINNVIYYDHDKKVVFNWLDYESKVTRNQFDKFIRNVDYSKLPDGVTFHYGKEEKK